jgi:hypothetical protein
MDTHVTFSVTVSILGMLLGFGLILSVSWRKATDRHDFRLSRMFGLLIGCLLVSMPLLLGAWLTRNDGGWLSGVFGLSAVLLGGYSPTLVLFSLEWIRGDAKQFTK